MPQRHGVPNRGLASDILWHLALSAPLVSVLPPELAVTDITPKALSGVVVDGAARHVALTERRTTASLSWRDVHSFAIPSGFLLRWGDVRPAGCWSPGGSHGRQLGFSPWVGQPRRIGPARGPLADSAACAAVGIAAWAARLLVAIDAAIKRSVRRSARRTLSSPLGSSCSSIRGLSGTIPVPSLVIPVGFGAPVDPSLLASVAGRRSPVLPHKAIDAGRDPATVTQSRQRSHRRRLWVHLRSVDRTGRGPVPPEVWRTASRGPASPLLRRVL